MGSWFGHVLWKRRPKQSVKFLRKGVAIHRTERTVPKKSRQHFLLDVIILWGLFLGTVIYIGFFSHFFLIQSVSVTGTKNLAQETLREFIERELAGKYLGIIPKDEFFVVRPRLLETHLYTEYPLLASVQVTRVFPNSIQVTVAEREKIIVVCSRESCFLVDEAGIAHENSRALSPENLPYVLFVDDMSSAPLMAEQPVFDAAYGTFITEMSVLFPKRLDIALEPRYTMVSRFANELRVRTKEGWEVYFGTEIPIASSLKALKLLLDRELPPEKREKLAYIDLRTENRAYYAFREEKNAGDVVHSTSSVSDHEGR